MSVQLGSAYGVIELDASGVESAVDKANSSLGQLGGGLAKVGLAAGAALVTTAAAGAAALAGVAASGVSMAKDLEAQMSGIQAVMGATVEEAAMLKETILELGIDPALKVTTLEAAAAVEMLGRNGLKTQEILDGAARATVLLANATGGEFGQSADIATDVMAQFNFQASEMETAVDGITSVITNSKFTITDYQFALANAGGVASAVGVEFDDFNTTVAAIAPLFASGATAGAGLQRFLSTLNPTSKPAIKAMQELGIWTEEAGNRFYDTEGNLKSMAEIAGILEETLSPLSEAQRTQALTTIFGARAMRVAVGLMNTGEEGFRSLQETMGDTSAAENAAIRMDNLAGAIEILMGIVDTVKIRIGDAFLPVLKDLADAASRFVSQHSDKFVGFFEKIADVITAFVSGSPGDYPWEDIFPPWLADLMYEIAGLVEGTLQVIQDMRDGVFGVDYPWEDVFPEWAADIAYKITDAIKFFQEHAEEFEAAIKAIGVTLAAAGIAAIVTTIAGALLSLINPVTIVLGLIGLLAAAWEGNWLGIRDKVQPIIDEIIPKIQELASSIGEFLGDAKEFVGDFISRIQDGEGPIDAFLGTLEAFGVPGEALDKIRELGEIVGSLAEYFKIVVTDGDTLNDWLTHLPEPIKPLVESFGELVAKVKEVGEKIGEFVGDQGAKISEWVEENRPLIEEFAQRIGLVLGILALVWAKVQTAALGAWDVILPILGGLVDLILGLVKTIMQVVTGDWEGAWETIKETAVKVWDAIKEAATNFGNWVAGWFGTSLSGIKETWSENWKRLKEIVGLVWEKIRFTVRAKWREVKQSITEPINNLVKEWSIKWEIMKARVERAFILMKNAIAQKWNEIKTGLTDGVKNFVARWQNFWLQLPIRIGAAFIRVKDAIMDKWRDIVAYLEGRVNDVVDWAKGIWENVKSTISGAWEGIKALLEQKVREMFETMGLDYDEYKARWAAIWEDVKLVVSTVWENIKTAVSEKVAEFIQLIVDFFEPKIQWWANLWESFKTKISEVWDDISAKVSEVWETISTTINDKVTTVVDWLTEKWDSIKEWWQGVWDTVSGKVSEAWETIRTKVSEVVESVRSTIEEKINAAKDAVTTAVSNTRDTAGGIWDEISGKVNEIWTAISGFISETVETIKTTILEKVEAIKTEAETKWLAFKTNVETVFGGVVTAVTTKMTEVYTTITGKIQEALAWVTNNIETIKQFGRDLVQGVIDGVAERAGALVSKLTGLAESALRAAKRAVGAESPAKEFIKIGEAIIEGWILGMLELEDELERTVANIANKIISVASSVASAGKFFAREFEKAALNPIAEKIAEYDQQLANLERFLGQEQESGNAIQEEYNRLLEERNKLAEEYEEKAKNIAEFERQQSRLQFLQQQVNLIRSIQDAGLDPAEILEGLNLGLDATLPELIEATSRFIGAMVDEANEILEIHSPSRVFRRIGEQSVAGFIEALKHAKSDVQKVTGQAIGGAVRPGVAIPDLAAMSALAPATGIYTTHEGNKALHIYGDVRLERVDSGEDLIERLLELE